MDSYQHKYNKYKIKYLMLKMQQNLSQTGGVVSFNDKMVLPMTEFIDSVNVVCRESLCCYNDCISNHKQLIKILTICNERKINVSKFIIFRTLGEKIVNIKFDVNIFLNYLVFIVNTYGKIKNFIVEFYNPKNKPPEKEKILSDCYTNYMTYYDKFIKQFCSEYATMFDEILAYVKNHKMPYVSIVVRNRNTDTTFDGVQHTLCDGSFINDCVLFLAAQKMPRIEMPLNNMIGTITTNYNNLFDMVTQHLEIPETEYEDIKTIPKKTEWLIKYVNENLSKLPTIILKQALRIQQLLEQLQKEQPRQLLQQSQRSSEIIATIKQEQQVLKQLKQIQQILEQIQQLSQMYENLAGTRKMIIEIATRINTVKKLLEKHNTDVFGVTPITLHMSQFGDDLQLHFNEIQRCNKLNVGNCKLPCEVKNGTCSYSTFDEIKESYKMADKMIALKRDDCKTKRPLLNLPTDGTGPCGDTNCVIDPSSTIPSCKYKEETGIEAKKKLGEYIEKIEKSSTKPKSKWGW